MKTNLLPPEGREKASVGVGRGGAEGEEQGAYVTAVPRGKEVRKVVLVFN
jgi:hypothetical protein